MLRSAAALSVVALLLPGVVLSAGAAIAAGVVASFARYFVGLYLDDKIPGDDHVLDEEDPGLDPSGQGHPPHSEPRG